IFMEGTNYDASMSLGLELSAHLTATGENLFNTTDYKFSHDSLLWRIYSTAPSNHHAYALGDEAREPSGTLFYYDRMRALFTYGSITDTTLKQQIRYWLDAINP